MRLAVLRDDLAYARRVLLKTPGFTVLAVLMLALGTGANVAMFSVIDGVLLRSPYGRPEEVARVLVVPSSGAVGSAVPVEAVARIAGLSRIVAATGTFTSGSPIVTNVDVPRRAQVECVSASMAEVLGTQPARGRWFLPAEDQPGAAPVGLVSHAFWRGVLNGDPDVLGRTIALDDVPVTVIGVMPVGFDGVLSLLNRDIWVPLGLVTGARPMFGCRPPAGTSIPFVRLHAGVSMEAATAAVNAAVASIAAPGAAPLRLRLSPLLDETLGDLRAPLVALTGAVLAVLLIACANVANLTLERLVGRRREIAVRLALGASRGRIVSQTLAETLLLATAGALGGVLIGYLTLDAIIALLPRALPHAAAITLNVRVLAASIGLALAGGLCVGLIPAFQASSPRLRPALTENDRGSTPGGRRLRSGLVVVELALGVALLIGAWLMVRTFLTLRPDAPGFDPRNKTMALVRLPAAMAVEARQRFVAGVTTDAVGLAGIRDVAATTYLPMYRSVALLEVSGFGSTGEVNTGMVSANYFEVMGIPVRRGRGFTDADGPAAPGVVVVNEEFVRRRSPGRDPIGVVVTIRGRASAPIEARVVGVIGDTRAAGMDTRARPEIYLPLSHTMSGSPFFIVSGSAEALAKLPPALRAIVGRHLPGQLVDRVESYQAFLGNEVSRPRFGAWLLGLFAALAVFLGAIGLGATLAWSVAERRREIGVRMALGAQARHVRGLVVGQTVRLAGMGIALGLGLAWFGTRLLEGWLYGITATDVVTYVACGVFMLVVALAAAYLPARRATRIDPLVAMRAD